MLPINAKILHMIGGNYTIECIIPRYVACVRQFNGSVSEFVRDAAAEQHADELQFCANKMVDDADLSQWYR